MLERQGRNYVVDDRGPFRERVEEIDPFFKIIGGLSRQQCRTGFELAAQLLNGDSVGALPDRCQLR